MWKPFVRSSYWVGELHLGIFVAWDRNLCYEFGINLFKWIFSIGFMSPELIEQNVPDENGEKGGRRVMIIKPIGYEVKPYGDYIIYFKDDEGKRFEWNVSTTPGFLLPKDKIIEMIRQMVKG